MERGSDSVRSLQRGLRLLQIMNQKPKASITELAAEAGMPRSTAYRLLDTMATMGFVSTISGRYSLARGVLTLSDGFVDEAWIWPAWMAMLDLSKALVWPLALSTLDVSEMVLRRTTHELSPVSIDHGMVGRRLPITGTAAGRTYLAFCEDAERELILSMQPQGASSGLDRDILDERLNRIRAQGFDTRIGGYVEKTGSLAVPLIVGERILGCLAVIFIKVGLSLDQAVAQFERPMKDAAMSIGLAIQERAMKWQNPLQEAFLDQKPASVTPGN